MTLKVTNFTREGASPEAPPPRSAMNLILTNGQYNLVYNAFSFVIACMGAALLFFLLSRERIAPRHRVAVTITTLVVAIALYHYVRIFGSFTDAFAFEGGKRVQSGPPFNEGYRYIDWLLTVPLLLAELVIVLKLSKSSTRSLIVRLTIAAIAMIALGWPGELSAADSTARTVWGVASTIPFLYILYVLFVELGKSLGRQSGEVKKLVDILRYIILATWGVYPLAYMAPSVIHNKATAEVARQLGYSIGDVLAKPLFGLLVFVIALTKSRADGYAPAGASDGSIVVPDDARELATD
jgi:bacteriorhodopsin